MLTLEKQNEMRDQFRDKVPGWRPATEQFAGLVRLYLDPDRPLLDIGCGRGGLIEQLDHPLHLAFGVDPDNLSLKEHRLQIGRAAGLSGGLPFRSNHFHLAYSSWLFEHLSSPVEDLAEIRRVLSPGGRFVFVTPNLDSPVALLNRIFGRIKPVQNLLIKQVYGREPEDAFPTFYRANSAQQLNGILEEVNRSDGEELKLESLYYVEDPTYLAFHSALFYPLSLLEKRLPQRRRPHLVGVLLKGDAQPVSNRSKKRGSQ